MARANLEIRTVDEHRSSVYEPTDDVIEFISQYMNDMQADALREIANGADGPVDEAVLTGLTAADVMLRVRRGAEWHEIAVPWPAPLQRREDIRRFLLELQDDARYQSWQTSSSGGASR